MKTGLLTRQESEFVLILVYIAVATILTCQHFTIGIDMLFHSVQFFFIQFLQTQYSVVLYAHLTNSVLTHDGNFSPLNFSKAAKTLLDS